MTTPIIDRPMSAYTEAELDHIIALCDAELNQANAYFQQYRATQQIKTLAMAAREDRKFTGAGRRKRLL